MLIDANFLAGRKTSAFTRATSESRLRDGVHWRNGLEECVYGHGWGNIIRAAGAVMRPVIWAGKRGTTSLLSPLMA